MQIYGQLTAEKCSIENEDCRNIVKEVLNAGLTQRQHLLLIYLLSMELENVEYVQTIMGTIKDLAGDEIFISKIEDSGMIS